MGRRGPQPQPTALKVLRGNPGKRALNTREPKADGIPDRPKTLSAGGRRAWDRLVPQLAGMGVLARIDQDALVLWCEAWGQWERCMGIIRRKGATYEAVGVNGQVRLAVRPEVIIERGLRRDLFNHGRDFGLTPASRAGLKTSGEEPEDPLEALLG